MKIDAEKTLMSTNKLQGTDKYHPNIQLGQGKYQFGKKTTVPVFAEMCANVLVFC
jgi:hypothetical protein